MIKRNSMLVAATVSLFTVVLLQTSFAFAGPCDPTFGVEKLTDGERTELNKTGLTRHDDKVGDYFVSYLVASASFDVELAMGVYTSCGEHAGNDGLGDFISVSEMLSKADSNPFQVYYVQSGSFGFSGGEYIMENTVRAIDGGYVMQSRLVSSSSSSFSPKVADGYVRMVADGPGKVSVVACNYMEPKSPPLFSKGKFNSMAKERLSLSGKNLMKWVARVSQDSAKAQEYREKLKRLIKAGVGR